MYGKILVPTDGSLSSTKAVKHAVEFASKLGSNVTLFHVVLPLPASIQNSGYVDRLLEDTRLQGKDILEEAQREFAGRNLNVDIEMVMGDPSHQICQKAKDYDLIIIGNRGLNPVTGFIMGSVSKRVARHAPCPVLIIR